MGEQFVPYEGTEPYIFVSYPRADKERVFPLLDALRARGYRIWRDEGGISPGSRWRREIADHLNRAAGYLVFWSKTSAASRHCYAEINSIIDFEDKEIVTVFLDHTPVTSELWLYLKVFQTVDLTAPDSDATFAEVLDRQSVFASCKAIPDSKLWQDTEEFALSSAPTIQLIHWSSIQWRKDGNIQWDLSKDGVLTIAKNTAMRNSIVPMPDYHMDMLSDTECGTAPWMQEWEKIRSVAIWNDIDRIGKYAFFGCKNMLKVTIPDSVTAIGDWAFAACRHLSNPGLTIPNSVTTIGKWAFAETFLWSVTIPDSVTIIGDWAFCGCKFLESVTIPDSVTEIGNCAFPPHTKIIRRQPDGES